MRVKIGIDSVRYTARKMSHFIIKGIGIASYGALYLCTLKHDINNPAQFQYLTYCAYCREAHSHSHYLRDVCKSGDTHLKNLCKPGGCDRFRVDFKFKQRHPRPSW